MHKYRLSVIEIECVWVCVYVYVCVWRGGSFNQVLWQLFIERKVWMAQQQGEGSWLSKTWCTFLSPPKITSGGQNAPGRPWWTSPCKGMWASWDFLGEKQACCHGDRHVPASLSSSAPSPHLAPGSPGSQTEGFNHTLGAQYLRTLLCTGFERRGRKQGALPCLTASPAGGRLWQPRRGLERVQDSHWSGQGGLEHWSLCTCMWMGDWDGSWLTPYLDYRTRGSDI